MFDVGTGNREDLLDIITNGDGSHEEETMHNEESPPKWECNITVEKHLAYPHNKFNPYDPNHVTLQLLQELHSQRMQIQIDRDKERSMRREEIVRHSGTRDDFDDSERKLIIATEVAQLYANTLREIIEQSPRSKGAEIAKHCLDDSLPDEVTDQCHAD